MNEIRVLTVEGMSCEHCVKRISNSVQALNGVELVSVDLENAKVTVEFIPDKVDLQTIKEKIEDAGYEVK